jgi:hypothetical protein
MPQMLTVDWPEDKLDEWVKLAKGRTDDFVSTFLQELFARSSNLPPTQAPVHVVLASTSARIAGQSM